VFKHRNKYILCTISFIQDKILKRQINYNQLLIILCFLMYICPAISANNSESEQNREYQVKAAFLYNFIKFVDWPKKEAAEVNEPIVISIIGKDPFKDAFEPIKKKQVKDKKVVIKRFDSLSELKKIGENDKSKFQQITESLQKSHLLFICSSEKDNLSDILKLLNSYPVLTTSETADFLEAGGIINFVLVENKVCFEINQTAAEAVNLKIRSQLLRLAKKVIGDKQEESSHK
jgi:hypothetical protein